MHARTPTIILAVLLLVSVAAGPALLSSPARGTTTSTTPSSQSLTMAQQGEENNTTTGGTNTTQPTELSAAQAQAIRTGVTAGINQLRQLEYEVSEADAQTAVNAAMQGADSGAEPVILEQAAYGVTFGALGEGASQEAVEAAIQGTMEGVTTTATENRNLSSVETALLVDDVAYATAFGTITGVQQNDAVDEALIQAAARGTAAGATDGAIDNLNATYDDLIRTSFRVSWAMVNIAATNPDLQPDQLEDMAYEVAWTALRPLPDPSETETGSPA